MSALRAAAEQAANPTTGETGTAGTVTAIAAEPAELVPFAELSGATSEDPPQVTVFVAWARVMRDVEGVGKNSVFKQTNQNGKEVRYNFRGVDAMINAFGPACRRHGVMVIPVKVDMDRAAANSSRGTSMRESTATVSWRIYGPKGDWIDGESAGESLDTGDKGTAKAQSVALRAFLIAAGLVPTDEKDPDAIVHERGERPLPKATDYRDEITDPRTSLRRLLQIKQEVLRHNLGDALVVNEIGDEEPLGKLLWRVGAEREKASGGES